MLHCVVERKATTTSGRPGNRTLFFWMQTRYFPVKPVAHHSLIKRSRHCQIHVVAVFPNTRTVFDRCCDKLPKQKGCSVFKMYLGLFPRLLKFQHKRMSLVVCIKTYCFAKSRVVLLQQFHLTLSLHQNDYKTWTSTPCKHNHQVCLVTTFRQQTSPTQPATQSTDCVLYSKAQEPTPNHVQKCYPPVLRQFFIAQVDNHQSYSGM